MRFSRQQLPLAPHVHALPTLVSRLPPTLELLAVDTNYAGCWLTGWQLEQRSVRAALLLKLMAPAPPRSPPFLPFVAGCGQGCAVG